MRTARLYTLDSNTALSAALAAKLPLQPANLLTRYFPDGEHYLRLLDHNTDRSAIILCSLNRPDEKILPLLLLCRALQEQGATSIGLIAPYLAYMRQDKVFNPGEIITSMHFARLLSEHINWLVTIDPHLHRYTSLDQIYSVPSRVAHAAPVIAHWIQAKVKNPLLIGPDSESEQWVQDIAGRINAPWLVLEKIRKGDRDVKITFPDFAPWQDRTPILLDDMISTGYTFLKTMEHLRHRKMQVPICMAVHGIFTENARESLLAAGITQIVTTNTIPQVSATLDISTELAAAVCEFI